jgi:uncharacterized membrane protein YidH (DUF202 family)
MDVTTATAHPKIKNSLKVMKNTVTILLMILAFPLFSMASQDVTMADIMRQEGKIYVVVAVMSVIFAGIVLFLILLERRISRLEKELNKKD